MRFIAKIALCAAILLTPLVARAETVLIMAEEEGCAWCARWLQEVGPEYPITAEGRAAPLRRVDVRHPPEDIAFDAPLFYTPTFVLVRDGEELGRIEGYPGEDFFWGLLGMLLKEHGIALEDSGSTG
ncbi:hypothetical protein [Vannielia sp.]|uniref:hypothetical protein n=1 Tax=Vannielia sp. TaxID=2813045 RepID=UPI002638C1D8|nr:hypothetical protein [Vannielia sp.]MDF1872397.1 hypothetical protein [Vannielia sp.]